MSNRGGFARTDRIAALLRREIGELVHNAVREKLIASVSVSDVEVTRDLAHATVYLTALRAETGPAVVKELNAASWEFRRELAHRVQLRSVPALHFRYDDSVDKGERIEALLREPLPGADGADAQTESADDESPNQSTEDAPAAEVEVDAATPPRAVSKTAAARQRSSKKG